MTGALDPEHGRVVTLLTDFGLSDPYVGVMKGVLLRESSKLRLIDVSHQVPPQDVSVAALWIARSYPFFPEGSVHLCVVDPGVGSARAPLAARVGTHTFVAPDNGLLSDVLAGAPAGAVRRIDVERLGLMPCSRTFHGRDVFAPVAGRLASDRLGFEDVGPPHEPLVLPRSAPSVSSGTVLGKVSFIDHFGNAITDIPLELVPASDAAVRVGGARLRVLGTYSEGQPDECIALGSSFGTLEIARRDGNAAATLALTPGSAVELLLQGNAR